MLPDWSPATASWGIATGVKMTGPLRVKIPLSSTAAGCLCIRSTQKQLMLGTSEDEGWIAGTACSGLASGPSELWLSAILWHISCRWNFPSCPLQGYREAVSLSSFLFNLESLVTISTPMYFKPLSRARKASSTFWSQAAPWRAESQARTGLSTPFAWLKERSSATASKPLDMLHMFLYFYPRWAYTSGCVWNKLRYASMQRRMLLRPWPCVCRPKYLAISVPPSQFMLLAASVLL